MRALRSQHGFALSLAASLTICCLGGYIGFSSISAQWAQTAAGGGGGGGLHTSFASSFAAIFLQNISVVLFLFSGVLTLGISTLISLSVTSVYVGATMSVAVSNSGVAGVVSDTGSYVGLEFLGLFLAATAGFCPLFALAGRALRAERQGDQGAGARFTETYVAAVRTSLGLLGTGAALVLLAALVEAAVIASA